MKLEIKGLYSTEVESLPEGADGFLVHLEVEVGEQGKDGAELFHFVAASALGLQHDVKNRDFHILRGYILMEHFDMVIVRRAIQNLVEHANSKENWHEVVAFLSRYGRYDSEDLSG